VADGVLWLDTRTGQISQCSRSGVGWACKVVPDERSALETEIARLQGENATLKKELLARGLPSSVHRVHPSHSPPIRSPALPTYHAAVIGEMVGRCSYAGCDRDHTASATSAGQLAVQALTGRPEPACSSCCGRMSPLPAGRVEVVQVPPRPARFWFR
jgi:hypothetical protein